MSMLLLPMLLGLDADVIRFCITASASTSAASWSPGILPWDRHEHGSAVPLAQVMIGEDAALKGPTGMEVLCLSNRRATRCCQRAKHRRAERRIRTVCSANDVGTLEVPQPNKSLQLPAALVTAAAICDDGSKFLWQPPRQPGAGGTVEG
jgi:hypothetical protein